MLEKIKKLLGIVVTDTSKDGTLNQLIEDTTQEVLNYCNITVLPITLDSTVRQIVIIKYNRLGIEGNSSYSEGGISMSLVDMPESILKQLKTFRKMR